MPTVPLVRALTEAGTGSRRRMTAAIKAGGVTVNGQVAESFTLPVDPEKDDIRLDGKKLVLSPARTICLALNKPKGVVSTVSDEKGRPTVLDVLPPRYRAFRLYPVGRLDRDTTGLLLLTNDGDLTYRLTHPKFEYEKEYLVRIEGTLHPEDIRQLEEGILLEDGPTRPAAVKKAASPFSYSVTIHEGRKRQVRRMFERLGHRVLELKRVRIGGLEIGDLEEGEVRELSQQELRRLDG